MVSIFIEEYGRLFFLPNPVTPASIVQCNFYISYGFQFRFLTGIRNKYHTHFLGSVFTRHCPPPLKRAGYETVTLSF